MISMTVIRLYDFPMPPSLNASYKTGIRRVRTRRGTRFASTMRSSSDLILFKNQVQKYWLQQRGVLEIASVAVQSWIKTDPLQIKIYFCWPEDKILTQTKRAKNKFHRLDADNRVKATLDGVSQCLGIDDSNFTKITVEKVILKEGTTPCAIIEISRTKIQTSTEILLQ